MYGSLFIYRIIIVLDVLFTCIISSDLFFSCRLSTFVFLLVHYNSNSVIFENCYIFILVYYITLISWSVEPGIYILNPGTVICALLNIESGLEIIFKILSSSPIFYDKLWRQNIELIIYFIPIRYGFTKYYGHNILTHSIVIAIIEKVQVIAVMFHITLHALNYTPWVTFPVQ